MMRIRFALLLAMLFLLASCRGSIKTDDPVVPYSSSPIGGDLTSCSIGDRVYSLYYGFHVYDAEGETVRRGLCRDPLCEHGTPSCPDFLLNRTLGSPGLATDGENLYVGAFFFETDRKTGQAERTRAVYAVRPDLGTVKKLCDVPTTGAEFKDIAYADGYVWFMAAYYNENYDPSSEEQKLSDQYAMIRRVKVRGGTSEAVTDERFSLDEAFYTDGRTLYVEERSTGLLRRISLENGKTAGEWEEIRLDGMTFGPVLFYEGGTYTAAAPAGPEEAAGAYTDVTGVTVYPLSVLRLSDSGEWDSVAEDVPFWSYRFADGALWYEPYAAESFGVTDSWNGRETVPREWVKNGTGTLCRVDLKDGSRKEWRFSDGRSIHALAVCRDSTVWALLEDYAAYVASDGKRDTEIFKMNLREDGIAEAVLSAGDLIE